MIEIINAESEQKKLAEKIEANCREYNTIAKRHALSSRIKYDEKENNLLLGRVAQFEYGTHQCILASDIDTAYTVAKAMSLQIHFEYES